MTDETRSAEEIARALNDYFDGHDLKRGDAFRAVELIKTQATEIAELRGQLHEADTRMRIEYCEATGYDCEALGKVAELEGQLSEETSRRYQAECNYDHWKTTCEHLRDNEILRRIDAIKVRLDTAESDAYGNADGFDPDMADAGLSVREVRFILSQLSASQQETRAAVECVEEVEYSLANSRFSAAWAEIRKWRKDREAAQAGEGERHVHPT